MKRAPRAQVYVRGEKTKKNAQLKQEKRAKQDQTAQHGVEVHSLQFVVSSS